MPARRPPADILDIHFLRRKSARLECEIMTLQRLFRRKLNHSLDVPQRIHFYLMLLITRGAGQHSIDFQTHAYQPRTLLCVAANQVQQFKVNPESDGYLVMFTPEFLYQHVEDRALLQGYHLFNAALQSPALLLSGEDSRRLAALLQEIALECQRPGDDDLRADIVRNLLRTVLLRAERLKRGEQPPAVLSHYTEFSLFTQRLEAEFSHTRNVKDYARALGVSAKKLNTLTHLTVNKTAKAFIDERVLLEIKRLLIHTNLSVKEIADRTGFDEPTNLVKFFRRHARQTPSQFRAAQA